MFEASAIVSHRYRRAIREYEVRWVGFPESENTWEPRTSFVGDVARLMLGDYDSRQGYLAGYDSEHDDPSYETDDESEPVCDDEVVRYEVGVSSPYDQDDEICRVFDIYEVAKEFFDRMVNEHPSAIRIDMESVDEDGDCLELLDTHGVYYTDANNWETIATNNWSTSRRGRGTTPS